MKQESLRSSKSFRFLRFSFPVRAIGIVKSAVLVIAFSSGAWAQCVLEPSTSVVPAGSSITITATGAPGGKVYFIISDGPNLAENSGLWSVPAWTYYTTHGIGTDKVTASGTYQGRSFTCAPAYVTWTPPSCSLAPTSGTALLGRSHTVVASVVNGEGVPVGNARVFFHVTSGPNSGRNSGLYLPATDAEGNVPFTYNSYYPPALGTDIIVVSGTYGSVSYGCSATVTWVPNFTCVEGSQVPVTLPLVTHSPAVLTKPASVSYGRLDLMFKVTKPYGTLCQAQSNLGALPLLVSASNGPIAVPVAKGETTATVTVLDPRTMAWKPPCSFWPTLPGNWTDDCILYGRDFDSQATYLKWYTPGFKMSYLPYVTGLSLKTPIADIPAMTFWVNLTQRGLNHSDMKTVLERIEPELHRELIGKLPGIAFWTVIHDPGNVRLLVIDPSGQTTGTLPDGRRTNDIANSFIYDDATNPGAFLLGAVEGSYMVILTGLRSGDFELAASNLVGDITASQRTVLGWVSKRGTLAYRVSTSAASGTPIQTITPASLVDGDLNGDERVDCADVGVVKASLGKKVGQMGYNAWADINADGVVDSRDVTFVTKRLPRVTCP